MSSGFRLELSHEIPDCKYLIILWVIDENIYPYLRPTKLQSNRIGNPHDPAASRASASGIITFQLATD